MNKQKIIDTHIHTDNSPDGKHSPMFICEQAVEKGLRAICFTDHCEIDKFFEEKYNKMVFNSFFESSKARLAFEGQLLVLLGVEMAQPLSNLTLSEAVIDKYNFDYILTSIHTPCNFDCDIKEIEYDKIDVYRFMSDYFEELAELAKWDKSNALAHITCPMRRIQGIYKIDFDYSRIKSATDYLLKTMIKNEKALEVNTSGLRQMMKRTMPDINIIKRYKELGGQLITIGSDAHSAQECGNGISEAIKILKDCGFDKFNFFINREPMEITIK